MFEFCLWRWKLQICLCFLRKEKGIQPRGWGDVRRIPVFQERDNGKEDTLFIGYTEATKTKKHTAKGKVSMLPLRLLRSLVLGDTINNHPLHLHHHHHHHDVVDDEEEEEETHRSVEEFESSRHKPRNRRNCKPKTPVLFFIPTKEVVQDTYRLATLARDMGMDLHPTPSLSHIIFSCPSFSSTSSSPSPLSSKSLPSSWSWSWSSSSSSWPLPNYAVPLPFPSLSQAPLTHLHSFVTLSRGLFKVVFVTHRGDSNEGNDGRASNWDCSSLSLFSRISGDRIQTMEGFCRALTGVGWSLFKTKKNPSLDSGGRRIRGCNSAYLFRKVESNRVRARLGNGDGGEASGECRVRELRLPPLDFRNAPLRILQYILLMTDDIFYLA